MSKDGGRSTVKTYAWDLETNYADEKIFELDYIRNTKSGSYAISDEREKYEFMANYAARRKRACIQAVIPGYIIDAAVEACEKTLEATLKNGNKTIEQVRADMLKAFVGLADWITEDMLASAAGKEFDKLNPKDIVRLRNLYNAIKDGFVKAEVAFGKEPEGAVVPTADETAELDKLNEQLKAGKVPNGTDEG
jgi:predicted phosphohydrolase